MSIPRTAPYRIARLAALAFTIFALAASSLAASPQASETRSAPERLSADTPRITPGGATFTVPSGWSIETGKDLVILTPPEPDTHIVIVDAQAADASIRSRRSLGRLQARIQAAAETGHAPSCARGLGRAPGL